MTSPVTAASTSLRPLAVPVWAWALVALALLALYVALQDTGTLVSAAQASYLHELTHDARHALGVPCH